MFLCDLICKYIPIKREIRKGLRFNISRRSYLTEALDEIMKINFKSKIVTNILILKNIDSSRINFSDSINEIIKKPKQRVLSGSANL